MAAATLAYRPHRRSSSFSCGTARHHSPCYLHTCLGRQCQPTCPASSCRSLLAGHNCCCPVSGVCGSCGLGVWTHPWLDRAVPGQCRLGQARSRGSCSGAQAVAGHGMAAGDRRLVLVTRCTQCAHTAVCCCRQAHMLIQLCKVQHILQACAGHQVCIPADAWHCAAGCNASCEHPCSVRAPATKQADELVRSALICQEARGHHP